MTTVPGNYVTDMTDAVSAGPQARNSRLRQEDIDSTNASKRALHMELVSWSTLRKSFSVEPLLESSQKKIDLSHCSEDGNKVSTSIFFCFFWTNVERSKYRFSWCRCNGHSFLQVTGDDRGDLWHRVSVVHCGFKFDVNGHYLKVRHWQ